MKVCAPCVVAAVVTKRLFVQCERATLCAASRRRDGGDGAHDIVHSYILLSLYDVYLHRVQRSKHTPNAPRKPSYQATASTRIRTHPKPCMLLTRMLLGLLFKLITLGVPSQLINILKSFFRNRHFYIKIGTTHSSTRSTVAGVSQGFCLSPHIFLI